MVTVSPPRALSKSRAMSSPSISDALADGDGVALGRRGEDQVVSSLVEAGDRGCPVVGAVVEVAGHPERRAELTAGVDGVEGVAASGEGLVAVVTEGESDGAAAAGCPEGVVRGFAGQDGDRAILAGLVARGDEDLDENVISGGDVREECGAIGGAVVGIALLGDELGRAVLVDEQVVAGAGDRFVVAVDGEDGEGAGGVLLGGDCPGP